MALPKKGSRKIIVSDVRYRYFISGNDGHIDLVVELEENNKQRLIVSFSYKTLQRDQSQRQITPATVKDAIEYALKNGWNPIKKGKEMRINDIEKEIDFYSK